MKKYKITGYVLGNLWGGGKGCYPAESLEGNDKRELIKKAEKMLNNGLLDSGMGFDGLVGAILSIETIETIKKNGKEYTNSKFDEKFIGKMSKNEENFLIECFYNQ